MAAGAGVLLSNPRHRAFYFGQPSRSAAFPPPTPFALPMPSGFATATAAPSVGHVVSASLPAPRVPVPDGQGRVRVPITDDMPGHLPAPGTPHGWELKEFVGDASVELVRSDGSANSANQTGPIFQVHVTLKPGIATAGASPGGTA